jgi:DNA-binding transcriptional MerR regulator/methylmalonyl-CoA mutase cobalamin-binding subunit
MAAGRAKSGSTEPTDGSELSTAAGIHDLYPLRTVTRLTGLSADVIRAWEKRHGVVTPVRGPRGARLYSSNDVKHLRLLERVVSSGRAIGDVAKLSSQQLDALVVPAAASAADQSSKRSDVIERALDAVRCFDSSALDRKLGDALMALGSVEFVRTVVSPLLTEIGDRWNRGQLSIADEHLVSGIMRNLLSGLLRSRAPARKPTVLLATPSGERHEFGLLIAALLVADAGIGVYYLGVDLPAAELAAAARRCDADVVGLGLANQDNHSAAITEVRQIEREISQRCELWLGGPDANSVAAELADTRALVLDDIDKMQGEIERLRAERIAGA